MTKSEPISVADLDLPDVPLGQDAKPHPFRFYNPVDIDNYFRPLIHQAMNHPELAAILEERLVIIADHGSRDRDPEAHLTKLMQVSEKITNWHEAHRGEIDGNLEHFLSGASFQKALEYLNTGTRAPCGTQETSGHNL